MNADGSFSESLSRIASRAKFDRFFVNHAFLARQPDGSFYLSGPYVRAGETEQPSFIHITSALSVPIVTSGTIATATVGQAFTYQITATNTPTSFGATGLPAGLSVNTSTGLISGTPTIAGVFAITLSATNAVGTGTATLTLTVNAAAPIVTSGGAATAILGSPFTFQIVATNQPASYGATNLPAGLTVNTSLGIISGVPTAGGAKLVTLTATNAAGTGSAVLTLSVALGNMNGITFINDGPNTARADQPFSFQIFATGISSAATFSAEGLPPGLAIDSATGVISGTPAEDGSFSVEITIADGAKSTTFTIQLTFTSDPAFPVITSPGSASLAAGAPFTYTIQAPVSGVEADDTTVFSLIGELPPGLTFDPGTGTISGTYNPAVSKAVKALAATTASVPSKSVVGTVQLVATNSHGTAIKTLVFLQAVPQLANISTRLNVGTEDSVLIGGFIVTGTAPKRVIIRAIGPALTGFGVNGALADPVLELHQPDQTVVTNDNWKESQETEIEATGLQPSQDLESAILAILEPGAYTAIVRGKDGGTGVGLVEVYDLDAAADSTLGNISTRGFVDTGDNVMIGGVIIGGASSQVLVRALGPVLADFGVSGALEDPVLELHDKDGALITQNDNWKESQQSAIEATGLAPTKDQESAILATLTPDNYTAIVRGKGDTTGVALVEVYNVTP